MKLNRGGYMLVEIIVAFVLAAGISYYLLNLTYRFKNLDEDIYQSYLYMQNKNLITKNVMNDLNDKLIISDSVVTEKNGQTKTAYFCAETADDSHLMPSVSTPVTSQNNLVATPLVNTKLNSGVPTVQLMVTDAEPIDCRLMKVETNSSNGQTTFYYGKYDTDTDRYDKNDVSYYERVLPDSLYVGDLTTNGENDEIVTFKLNISSIYDSKDYSIKINANSRLNMEP